MLQNTRLPVQLTFLIVSLVFFGGCQSPGLQPVTDAQSESGLAYDLAGDGPLVVLIHGTNLDRRMWAGEIAWLQKDARVLRYDLRGQGGSSFPAESYSNHFDLIELLTELGHTEATFVGLSAGAQVAVDLALEAPQMVTKLVLASPSLIGYTPEEMPTFFGELMSALKAGDYKQANEVLLAAPVMSVPSKHSNLVRTMVEENERLWTIPYSLVEMAAPLAIKRLEQIEAPTLVLVGENDLEAIRAQAELLTDRLPNVQRITIPAGGHLLNLTSPDEFQAALNQFLAFTNGGPE